MYGLWENKILTFKKNNMWIRTTKGWFCIEVERTKQGLIIPKSWRHKWFEGQIYMIELMVFDMKQIIDNVNKRIEILNK